MVMTKLSSWKKRIVESTRRNNDKPELNEDVDNFSYDNNQDIKKNISNYVVNLHSLKLPELTITKILETMSGLIFPFLDNIVSIQI